MFKITSGALKNRLIFGSEDFFEKNRVRPTSNYTKQLIFNIVKNSPAFENIPIQDAIICDVCSGSGAIGFEFISNGAKKCYFIDSNMDLLKNVENTASSLEISEQIQTLRSMTKIKEIKDQIDIVFIDPPYQEQERIVTNFISIAKKSTGMSDKTVVILESSKSLENLLSKLNCEVFFSRKVSNKTNICAFFLK